MAFASSDTNFDEVYSSLIQLNDETYTVIEQAALLTDEGKAEEALKLYEQSLIHIDKALHLPIECPSNSDSKFEKALDMVQKLRIARKNVLCQIATCQTNLPPPSELLAPPSYEEATSSSYSSSQSVASSAGTITYSELGNMLENLKVDIDAQSAQVILTCDNVCVYYISLDGIVTAPSEPHTLRIFELDDGNVSGAPRYYLQIGAYLYPLVTGVSPCLRAEYGALILPDLEVGGEGNAVGLVLPPESEDVIVTFLENILQIKLLTRPSQLPQEESKFSTKLSSYIISGASVVSRGLINGAHFTEQLIETNAPKLKENLRPTSEKFVSPKFQRGIKIARDVTATTASITGFVASQVGAATMCLGKYLAPHVKKGGEKLLIATMGLSSGEAKTRVDDILTVTAGAVEGLVEVYSALEYSGQLLGRSLKNNTVDVIKHKYGDSAAKATENTFLTVANSIQIGNNVRIFKPKTLAKRTVRNVFCNQNGSGPNTQSNGLVGNASTSKECCNQPSTSKQA